MESKLMLELIEKYLEGTATPEEMSVVDLWYYSMEGNEGLTDNFDENTIVSMETDSFAAIQNMVKNYPAN